MKTEEHLEAITDDGKFEKLATAILSKADKNYEAIIHFGINAQGKTITSPNDGFCKVPYSSPPHFLWAQHTTTERKKLRAKWLDETDGDLIKAAKSAEQLRKEFPDGKFTVILSTNQRIPTEPNEPDLLAEAVYKKAKELDVEAIIWEQSRYARFLDSYRDGQWFRKEFFGTEAQMLSEFLLADLSKISLANYTQVTNPENWILRQIDNHLWDRRNRQSYKLVLLVGESGFGKSAAAYRLLRKHIEAGGYGFHIPESIIQESISLDEALQQILTKLYHSLLSQEATRIPEIIPSGSPFIIVVDDINQTNDPTRFIRKLVGWAKQPFLIVCPVWPRYWQIKQNPQDESIEQNPQDKSNVYTLAIERMLEEEGREAVETVVRASGFGFSKLNIRRIAGQLRYDPLLIGYFGELLSNAKEDDIENLVENVIQNFIKECISNKKYFASEYEKALARLVTFMLKYKNLSPNWNDEIRAWFQADPESIDILRDLCNQGKLCRVEDGKFKFQHDRLLYHFLVESMTDFLNNPSENSDVLFEPYYAEIIGQALLRVPQDESFLGEMLEKLPLALVSAVRYMGEPHSEYQKTIIRGVTSWVKYRGQHTAIPESVRGEVANSFINTDSPVVLEIVNNSFGLEVPWLSDWARFRNGDAAGGVKYCRIAGMERHKGNFWEELVEHARQYHREELIKGLQELFESLESDTDFRSALILAGFLGLPELQEGIANCWGQLTDKSKCFTEMLWAAFRCSSNISESDLLNSMMTYWATLPDVDESKRIERREIIAGRLGSVLAPDTDQNLVDYLILQSSKHKVLRHPIGHICGLIDLPDSIEFAVHTCTEKDIQKRPCSIETNWASFDQPKLSSQSVLRLWQLWNMSENSGSVRKLAFHLWLENLDRDTNDILAAMSPISSSEPFFDEAIWERTRLNDITCVPDLLSLLRSDTRLFRVAHLVWCDEIRLVAEKYLKSFEESIPKDFSGGRLNEHYFVAKLLRMVPTEDAETLLAKYWGHLRYSRLFVQCALFVGTLGCLTLAKGAIDEYPDNVDPFEHIDQFFGVFGFGHGLSIETTSPRITLQHIKNLQPYLHRLDETALGSFASVCYLLGDEAIEWCEKSFPEPIVEGCRKKYRPTDEDLVQILEAYSKQHLNMISHWLEGFKQRNDPRNPVEILDKWLKVDPDFWKLKAAARCIEEIGTRKDLKILEVSPRDLPENHWLFSRVKENAKFAVYRRTLQ